jgi:hypothetical protein
MIGGASASFNYSDDAFIAVLMVILQEILTAIPNLKPT